jgi:hypothetical protein
MVMDRLRRWKTDWKSEFKEHKGLIALSLIFLVGALVLNSVVGNYADRVGNAAASDLILEHVGPVDWTYLFVYGYGLVILLLFVYPLLFRVREFHIAISQFSLLVLIRSFFISLTHLKVPTDAIAVSVSHLSNLLIFRNDLFFSAHTALPFLGFLLFRKHKIISTFFLIMTFVLAATVLLMHIHYSIDVFAAFFITYGSYKIGEWLFRRVNHY